MDHAPSTSSDYSVASSSNGSSNGSSGGQANGSAKPAQAKGLRFEPYFCPTDVADPFETTEYSLRSAQIKGENGEVIFEQNDCEFPEAWSTLAANIVANKYFYGEPGTDERETSVRQVIYRVSRTIADWGREDGYFASDDDAENFYRELTWLVLHQHGSFNSPVWFNCGLHHVYGVGGSQGNYWLNPATGEVERPATPYEKPQMSACFIQAVDDTMEDIMRLATSEAMLFKFGSGTGSDLSTIRSSKEKLSGGGTPSGPLSFMRVYDQIAAVVKSGGKTRRAAKMQSIKDWHPDVMDFIQCKAKEEKKARTLIDSGEYDANFNGEAYGSIMFQNANLSVRLSDDFMQAVLDDATWTTKWVTEDGKDGPSFPAREMLHEMAFGTWYCGDPGVQYDTTINKWHTCKASGRINASNPCSEYMFLDDTACNLASINLKKCLTDSGTFDVERFRAACRVFITAQEIIVDRASYPTAAIARNSHLYRPLGLGFANLGSMLMELGHAYDSDAGRGFAGAITALMNGQAYLTSSHIAEHIGPFAHYEPNAESMLGVMRMHRAAVDNIDESAPADLVAAAASLWNEVVASGERHGYRNAQATVLAPTGTIAFMMDCDTTGIEPDIALVKYKQLAGGGMIKIVNQTVPAALDNLGYSADQRDAIVAFIDENDTIEGAPALKDEHLPVFDCAFQAANGSRSIPWQAHITMMAAAQPFLSGAISKTVNMPEHSTVEDIEQAYIDGWQKGLKAIAIYRDGSKQSQPLATKKEGDKDADATGSSAEALQPVVINKPRRRRMPDTRQSVTHKFSVGGHEGYVTVGLFEDGQPGELFVTMAKEGSTVGGLMDVIGTQASMALQYGVPLESLVNKFAHMRFEPAGWTPNPDIPMAKSIPDYIFRWLGMQFLDGYRQANAPQRDLPADDATDTPAAPTAPGPAADTTPAAPVESTPAAAPVAELTTESTAAAPAASDPAPAAPTASGAVNRIMAYATTSSPVQGLGVQVALNPAPSGGADSSESPAIRSAQFANFQSDAPACDNCGAITVRNGNCYLCHNCGASMGCS